MAFIRAGRSLTLLGTATVLLAMAIDCSSSSKVVSLPNDAGGSDAGVGGSAAEGGAAGSSGGVGEAGGQAGASPDAACSASTKRCGASCVPVSDPSHGCADPSCVPCSVSNATARCGAGGECEINVCDSGWDDCNGSASDGCEHDVTLDPGHCGRCDHDCLGGSCVGGECSTVELASFTRDSWIIAPWGVAVDDTYVYFTVNAYGNAGAGYVGRVAKTGGAVLDLRSGETAPYDIVLDEENVYWSNNLLTGGQIRKLPKSGGTAGTLAADQDRPVGLSLDSVAVFWSSYTSGAVRRVDKAGGSVLDLVTGQGGPRATVTDAVVAGFVYFVASGDGLIKRVPKAGGSATPLSEGLQGVWALARGSTQTDLFFTRFVPAGDIRKVAAAPGSTSVPLVPADSVDQPYYVAVDGTHVYWTTHVASGGVVARVPTAGGPTQVLARGLRRPAGIALDNDAVYFAESDANRILKVAK